MLVVDGEVKLLDFGIASNLKGDSNLAGTLDYMAPELLLGQTPSIRSDLYAVGVLFFQLLICVASCTGFWHVVRRNDLTLPAQC